MNTKTIMRNILASLAVVTTSTAIALPSQTLNSGETYSASESIMIRSVYCINTASGAGTNESAATLKMTTSNEYYKEIPWLLDNYGDFEVPSSLECELYYGPSSSPFVGIAGTIDRVNPMAGSGDAYLYKGTFVGAFTNDFPIRTGVVNPDTYKDTNVLAIVSTYTDESNSRLVMECIITNTLGGTAKIPNTNMQFIKQTATINLPLNINFYAITNDGPSGVKFVTSTPEDTTIKSYTFGPKRMYYSKDESFSIATISTGTAAYAVTNDVNYLVPYGFKLQTQTVSPFTKIGFIYE